MYEQHEFKRGQIYWVLQDVQTDDQTPKYRPGVIVSTDCLLDGSNEFVVVYLTTQDRGSAMCPDVWSTGKKSWALCNHPATVGRQNINYYIGTMTEYEMAKIETALCVSLGMAPSNSSLERENEKLREEKAQLESELTLWRKLYDKTMDTLVETKYAADIASRTERKATKVPRMVPDEPEIDEELESRRSARVEVAERVADVNTMKATEIAEITGMPVAVAYGITAYRKKYGLFTCIEGLLETPRFKESHLKKYGKKLVI